MAEFSEEEACEKSRRRLREETPNGADCGDRRGGGSIESHDAGGIGERRPGDIELVVNLTDDLFEDIFRRDETDGGSKLIDDDGDLAAMLLKVLQKFDGELGLGHQP